MSKTHGEDYENFGKALASIRESVGLSQYSVSDSLGIPQSTYAGYEKGNRKIPLSMIIALANFFGVSVDYLLQYDPVNINIGVSLVLTEKEKQTIEKYRKLDSHGRTTVDFILDQECSRIEMDRPKTESKIARMDAYKEKCAKVSETGDDDEDISTSPLPVKISPNPGMLLINGNEITYEQGKEILYNYAIQKAKENPHTFSDFPEQVRTSDISIDSLVESLNNSIANIEYEYLMGPLRKQADSSNNLWIAAESGNVDDKITNNNEYLSRVKNTAKDISDKNDKGDTE